MFENLSERLERSFKILKGEGKITEVNVAETLKEIRRALLDADVSYKVAKDFCSRVKDKAMGANVLTAVKPQQMMVKIVHDELAEFMGSEHSEINVKGSPAIVLVALIVRGFWSFGKYRWVLIGYTVFTFGLISIFSTPSENRYLTALIPFLNMGLLVGLYEVVVWALRRMGSKLAFSPWILALLLLTSVGNIKELHAMNRMPFPPAYQNFFRMGAVLKEHVSPETVVASRKGELLYMFSGTRVTGYAFSQDDRAVIQKMLDDGVEYVILDQLGYSSTYRYLYPAIQKNDDLFFP